MNQNLRNELQRLGKLYALAAVTTKQKPLDRSKQSVFGTLCTSVHTHQFTYPSFLIIADKWEVFIPGAAHMSSTVLPGSGFKMCPAKQLACKPKIQFPLQYSLGCSQQLIMKKLINPSTDGQIWAHLKLHRNAMFGITSWLTILLQHTLKFFCNEEQPC